MHQWLSTPVQFLYKSSEGGKICGSSYYPKGDWFQQVKVDFVPLELALVVRRNSWTSCSQYRAMTEIS